MAGMPQGLLQRAHEILRQLEDKQADHHLGDTVKALSGPRVQLSIFDTHSETFGQIRGILDNIDINRLTPVEALLRLSEIKKIVQSSDK
jgi:DNA mismatch repair protein MutS